MAPHIASAWGQSQSGGLVARRDGLVARSTRGLRRDCCGIRERQTITIMNSQNTEISTAPNPARAVLPWLHRAALRHWILHVCASAAPSFVFMVRGGFDWSCVTGMLLGVGFFSTLYTVFAR